jgi:signal transduction histidine kinase
MAVREREWLSSLDMDIYVPLCTEAGWTALMALGPRQTGQPYSGDDLSLLCRLANQTAATLQTARQFELMKAHSAECERIIWMLSADKQALARLDQDKADFLGIAARELRGQLLGIKGYVDLLCEMVSTRSLTPEQGNELIEGIRNCVQDLDGIAQTLRDASKMEIEAPELRMQPVSIERAVEAAASPWAEAFGERSLTFSTQGLEDLPTIMADGRGLRAVFAELLKNAYRFTPNGGHIQVRGILRDGRLAVQDQSVEIVVADTGPGIDRDDLARVFDPFFRRGEAMASGVSRSQFTMAGPGLGLSRVRVIVQAHGGRIWAESPGCSEANCPGTEMHLVLPLMGDI